MSPPGFTQRQFDDALAAICDYMGLIGTPEYCAERVRKAEQDGLTHLYLMTGATYEFATGEMAAFRDHIFPALNANGG